MLRYSFEENWKNAENKNYNYEKNNIQMVYNINVLKSVKFICTKNCLQIQIFLLITKFYWKILLLMKEIKYVTKNRFFRN